jgi:5-methylcytosine-specific restriction endonuclease McrA
MSIKKVCRMSSKESRRKREKIALRDGSYCCYCGRFLSPLDRTIEHYKPKSLGGTNRFDNLKIACKPCNQKRGNNPVPPPLKKPSSFPQGNSSFPAPQRYRSSSLNNSGK